MELFVATPLMMVVLCIGVLFLPKNRCPKCDSEQIKYEEEDSELYTNEYCECTDCGHMWNI